MSNELFSGLEGIWHDQLKRDANTKQHRTRTFLRFGLLFLTMSVGSGTGGTIGALDAGAGVQSWRVFILGVLGSLSIAAIGMLRVLTWSTYKTARAHVEGGHDRLFSGPVLAAVALIAGL